MSGDGAPFVPAAFGVDQIEDRTRAREPGIVVSRDDMIGQQSVDRFAEIGAELEETAGQRDSIGRLTTGVERRHGADAQGEIVDAGRVRIGREAMRHVAHEEHGIARNEASTARLAHRRRGQMQPARAFEDQMKARPLMSRRRCAIRAAIPPYMKERAVQVEPGEQPVGGLFGGCRHDGIRGEACEMHGQASSLSSRRASAKQAFVRCICLVVICTATYTVHSPISGEKPVLGLFREYRGCGALGQRAKMSACMLEYIGEAAQCLRHQPVVEAAALHRLRNVPVYQRRLRIDIGNARARERRR
jgi:hypothetical protein